MPGERAGRRVHHRMTGRGVDGADRGVVDDPVAEFGRHPDRDERGTSGEQPFLGAAVGAEQPHQGAGVLLVTRGGDVVEVVQRRHLSGRTDSAADIATAVMLRATSECEI